MGKRFGLLAGLLVLVLGSGVVAQESPPPPWFGGRVEMPNHGFAVTIPEDWVAFDFTGDVDLQARQAVGTTDADASQESVVSVIETLRYAQQQGVLLTTIATTPPWSSCSVWVLPSVGEDLDLFAALWSDGVTSDERTDCDRPEPVELPLGPARLVACDSDVAESAQYVGGGIDAGFVVSCSGEARPDDDWLSVAETFEWLLAEG